MIFQYHLGDVFALLPDRPDSYCLPLRNTHSWYTTTTAVHIKKYCTTTAPTAATATTTTTSTTATAGAGIPPKRARTIQTVKIFSQATD